MVGKFGRFTRKNQFIIRFVIIQIICEVSLTSVHHLKSSYGITGFFKVFPGY